MSQTITQRAPVDVDPEERTGEPMEVAVALAQARTGRPYDPWDWTPITAEDAERATALLAVLTAQRGHRESGTRSGYRTGRGPAKVPDVTEPAALPTAASDDVWAEYTLADILAITEAAERNGVKRALALIVEAAPAHRGHSCRPAACIREVAERAARELGA